MAPANFGHDRHGARLLCFDGMSCPLLTVGSSLRRADQAEISRQLFAQQMRGRYELARAMALPGVDAEAPRGRTHVFRFLFASRKAAHVVGRLDDHPLCQPCAHGRGREHVRLEAARSRDAPIRLRSRKVADFSDKIMRRNK